MQTSNDAESTRHVMCEDNNKPVAMPMNVVAHIFSFLTRDEIEICRLVCKSWHMVIRCYNKDLPKRQIDCVWLSTSYEYGATIRYGNRVKQLTLKKYFRAKDMRSGLMLTTDRVPLPHEPTTSFPCKRPVLCAKSILELNPFLQYGITHHVTCKNLVKPRLYNLMNSYEYQRKLFTPPYAYYEKLQWLLADCEVRSLVFWKFTFTNFFVEKFAEFFAKTGPFQVENLNLHSCSLRYVHSDVFHQLLGQHIRAERYFMECLRFCLPNHISFNLIRQPNIKAASIFFVGQCFARDGLSEIRFSLTDDQFREHIDALLHAEQNAAKRTNRQFFGIRQAEVTELSVNQYHWLYEKSNKKKKTLLYDQVMFARWRFFHQVSLDDLNEMAVELV